MKIYSMTATFGKLSHQTLTLTPGLNVIHAPNEWGKSTWCAFLAAMLYGIDTRERTTQTSLADKEHYTPWSGEPMSGKIELNWNGKDITIERRTKGRVLFGDFQAYETQSGLSVPELTAENCGEKLLGVEKSVFTRSAFVRMTDLPVAQDDALRRRLNALVTTGNENNAGDDLAQKLKDLKNKCRHNRTGLLPQAEAERTAVTDKLNRLRTLQEQISQIEQRQATLTNRVTDLENHRSALAHEASQDDARRVEHANAVRDEAARKYEALSAQCEALPTQETAEQTIVQLEQLRIQWEDLQSETLPPVPEKPEAPQYFAGTTPEAALVQAKSDFSAYNMLSKPVSPVLLILSILGLVAGICLGVLISVYAAIALAALAAMALYAYIRGKSRQTKDREAITAKYGSLPPEAWVSAAQAYVDTMAAYTASESAWKAGADSLSQKKAILAANIEFATQGLSLHESLEGWRETLCLYDDLQNAHSAWKQATDHAAALAAVAKVAPPPTFPDMLTLTREETDRQLADAAAEQRQLHVNLGQYQGQMQSLGSEESLTRQLSAIQKRIDRLEDIYAATIMAMETLTAASQELQRRFAPRIAQRAQGLFSRLTHGRYNRLQLTQELALHAGAEGEDTLRTALWRSDGTADQLYLALRLAVAEELTPEAPLVLDDVFVRFDDDRLALAMDILKDAAKEKQVILFTCQKRELNLI